MNVDALLRATTRVWTFTLPCLVLRQLGMRSVRARNSSGPGRAMTERGLTESSMTVEIRELPGLMLEAVSASPDDAFTRPPRGWEPGRAPLHVSLSIYAPGSPLPRNVSAVRPPLRVPEQTAARRLSS